MTTPTYQAPAAAPGGYTSPIPVVPAGLGNALRSEWTKIRTVRSTMWTLGVMVLLVVGIGLLVAGLENPHHMGETPVLVAGFTGVLLGSLCVMTLGVLVVTSEYGTGMMRTTLTAFPSRTKLLTAKALVFTVLAFVVTAVSTGIVALADKALLSGAKRVDPICSTAHAPVAACARMAQAATISSDQWLRGTLGISLYVALLGLLSLAVGALLRHSAGAITAMMGVVLLPLIVAIFMAGQSLEHVRNALIEYCVPNGMATLYDSPFLDSGPKGWDPLWILLAVTVVALAGAYAAINKRDV